MSLGPFQLRIQEGLEIELSEWNTCLLVLHTWILSSGSSTHLKWGTGVSSHNPSWRWKDLGTWGPVSLFISESQAQGETILRKQDIQFFRSNTLKVDPLAFTHMCIYIHMCPPTNTSANTHVHSTPKRISVLPFLLETEMSRFKLQPGPVTFSGLHDNQKKWAFIFQTASSETGLCLLRVEASCHTNQTGTVSLLSGLFCDCFFLPLFSKFLQCVKQLGLQAMPLKHSDKWLGVVFGFNCQFNISRHHLGKAFQMIVTDPPVCRFVGDYLDCSCWGRKHISWAGSPTSSYKKGCCVLAWVLACSH